MKNIFKFKISKGDKFYIASGINLPVVTQAKNFDELEKNIIEALELYLTSSKASSIKAPKRSSILVNFELPVTLCLG